MAVPKLDVSRFKGRDRSHILFLVQSAEIAERYEDMCQFVRLLVTSGGELTQEEMNFMAIAYKNVVVQLRDSWRALATPSEAKLEELLSDYKKQVEREVDYVCRDALDLLENHLIKRPSVTPHAKVFYFKMAGDYNRYLAEVEPLKGFDQKAVNYYKEATKLAGSSLEPTNPTRLGVALNYSVCLYEILRNKKMACDIAKGAFDKAIDKLDDLEESHYKDSTLIMQLLRDNLTLWTAGDEQQPQ